MKENKLKKLFTKKEKVPTYHKLFIYAIIVNTGYSEPILSRLKEEGSNAQVVLLAKGTANKEVLHVLGLENNDKETILALVDETNIKSIQGMLKQTFDKTKKSMGIAFAIRLNSIVGEKVYHFLTNTI